MDQQEAAWCREAHDRYDNYAMLARLFQREVDAELLADLKESFAAEPTGDSRFDEGCALLRRYLDGAENDYAHVICFAPHVPASIAELSAHAGHVTLFLCSDESWPEALYADNVHVMAFTPENYLRELSYIAI